MPTLLKQGMVNFPITFMGCNMYEDWDDDAVTEQWNIPEATDKHETVSITTDGKNWRLAISCDMGYEWTNADLSVIIKWIKENKPELLL